MSSSACAPNLGQAAQQFQRPSRAVSRVFIHCSAASRRNIDADEIDRWHTSPPNNWSCIGYHYFIMSDGTVELGRDLEKTPAAQGGNNKGTIAICLNGLLKIDFTREQFESLRNLCRQIDTEYPGITFHGHKEVSNKACPVFDYREVLNLDPDGHMVDAGDLLVQHDLRTIGTGDQGTSVQVVQTLLGIIPLDGIFGHSTSEAVTKYQIKASLTPDGIVGERTWRSLLER